jgi:peroxiredoxin
LIDIFNLEQIMKRSEQHPRSFALQLSNGVARSAFGLLAVSFGLFLLAGCNRTPPGENSAATPPKLSIGADQSADNTPPATTPMAASTPDAVNSGAAPTDASANAKQQIDPQLQAIINDLEANAKAWQEGQSFDFALSAAKIAQRLNADFGQMQLELAHDAGQLFVMAGAYGPARQVYDALANAAEKHSDSKLSQQATEIAHTGLRKLNLVGSTPKIEGTVFGGQPLDWSKYQGKVVLIDFWATWCPHCVEEMPDVKQIYDQYHDQGFEVIGVSLDDDKKALTDFLDKKQLPWITLFDDDPSKQGWEGAAMTKPFAIEELPTMIMIDRAGKVISISARGDALPKLVGKLIAEK